MGEALGCVSRDEEVQKDDPDKWYAHPNQANRANQERQNGAGAPIPPLSFGTLKGAPEVRDTPAAVSEWNVSRSIAPGTSTSLWTETARASARDHERAALAKLREGNLKYVSGAVPQRQSEDLDAEPVAIFACCTPMPAPLEVIFGLSSGEIACSASASLDDCIGDDGGTAAMEFSMATQHDVSLMVVMETFASSTSSDAAESVVWAAIERLLKQSEGIRKHLRRGAVYLHGALLDLSTGQVHFLGEHWNKDKLMLTPRACASFGQSFLNSRSDPTPKPPIPAEEALAMLQCGNLRAHATAVVPGRNMHMSPRSARGERSNDDVCPCALAFVSFDSHAGEAPLVEVIFDTHPSQIASQFISDVTPPADANVDQEILNACTHGQDRWQGYVTWAEFLLTQHAPRLLLVLGRAPANASDREVSEVRNKVFQDMLNLLQSSKLIKHGVADGRLEMEGAIYHGGSQLPPGIVEWVGSHPQQKDLLHNILSSSISPASMVLSAADAPGEQVQTRARQLVQEALSSLQAGNDRYLASGPQDHIRWPPEKLAGLADQKAAPSVLIVAGANGECRNPEHLFDSGPGELVVHRTCGALSGRRGGCALSFLERQVKQNPGVPILIVLGDVRDPAIGMASAQVQRIAKSLKHTNAQMAMEQLAPAAVHAMRQSRESYWSSEAQQQAELVAVATEFHITYVMERMLFDSDIIFDLVRGGLLQVQGAVAQFDGTVRFTGGHADLQRVLDQRARAEKHIRKGQKLGPKRPD